MSLFQYCHSYRYHRNRWPNTKNKLPYCLGN